MNKIKEKFAFTLTEILITFVIIGIIAAITVPSVIKKYKDKELVTRLKKTYSTLTQVTNQIIAEEGSTTNWATSPENIYNLYKKHLEVVKDCGQGEGCWAQGRLARLNKTGYVNWNVASEDRKFILADGTQFMFGGDNSNWSSTCSFSENNQLSGTKDFCLLIHVDINGERKPNTIGRDIFVFALKKNGLYPAGCDYANSCTDALKGYGCACRVLKENAINY